MEGTVVRGKEREGSMGGTGHAYERVGARRSGTEPPIPACGESGGAASEGVGCGEESRGALRRKKSRRCK